MRTLAGLLASSAAALILSTASTLPAGAKIACRNGFQVVQGNLLATPYCQDELVAQVARERGFKVSARDIRENPNLKRNVCRFIGHDNRVSVACIDANGFGRGRRG